MRRPKDAPRICLVDDPDMTGVLLSRGDEQSVVLWDDFHAESAVANERIREIREKRK